MRYLLAVAAIGIFATSSLAQSRDYLTDAEIEVIRDTQQIDKRVEALVHAIDRRFAVLKIDVAAPGLKKGSGDWGDPPAGTRQQLLYDIKRILQKAIEDIDNLSERPTSLVVDVEQDPKKVKGFSELFPIAVRTLAAAAQRYRIPLRSQLDSGGNGSEKGSVLDALDMCAEVIAAVEKLPKDTAPPKKKGN